MTRENKLALVLGFALILLVGILISDHFSTARLEKSADLVQHRPDDPLAEGRRSAGPLLDLHPAEERAAPPRPGDFLAMNPGQIGGDEQPSRDVPVPAPAEQRSNGAQRIAMGEPVPDGGSTVRSERSADHDEFIFHNVRPGESLSTIARRYYGDDSLVRELARFNGIDDPNTVRVDHRLRIPDAGVLVRGGRRPDTTAQQPPPAASQPVYRTYTVKPGDTLSEIAQQQLGTARRWRELYELNKDDIRDPDNVPVGTVLKIPRPR